MWVSRHVAHMMKPLENSDLLRDLSTGIQQTHDSVTVCTKVYRHKVLPPWLLSLSIECFRNIEPMFYEKGIRDGRHSTQIFWFQSVSQSTFLLFHYLWLFNVALRFMSIYLLESSGLIRTLGPVMGLHELPAQVVPVPCFFSWKAVGDLGWRFVFLYLTRRDSTWGLERPVIELCWSYSTPKDCLLTLGTDTHRGLPPSPCCPSPQSLYNTTDLPNWNASTTSPAA